MIELNQISKRFGKIEAVSQMTGEIREGSVFGLVGTNGAGKSTCLRMMAGVLKPDEGRVLVDGQDIYENEKMKSRVFFISDDQYYLPNSTPEEMMEYYRIYYTCFDEQRFYELLEKFGLEKDRKISTFSKGMKKQLSVILGICSNTKYLLCDETFDGLDSVMRQAVKSIFAMEFYEDTGDFEKEAQQSIIITDPEIISEARKNLVCINRYEGLNEQWNLEESLSVWVTYRTPNNDVVDIICYYEKGKVPETVKSILQK